jgi:hypothetical protein
MTRALVRNLIRSLVFTVIIAAALFVSAGSIDWPMAWAYILAFAVTQVLNLSILARASPALSPADLTATCTIRVTPGQSYSTWGPRLPWAPYRPSSRRY